VEIISSATYACIFWFKDTVMWFSSGGSKSFLHMDTVDNINCMISGVKEWFIVDLVNKECLRKVKYSNFKGEVR